jgi:hypothetical protein
LENYAISGNLVPVGVGLSPSILFTFRSFERASSYTSLCPYEKHTAGNWFTGTIPLELGNLLGLQVLDIGKL